VGLNQVEQHTAIRTRYIKALEDERFDVLPGPTYTRGFLRAYADYLGLDGQLFVDEFNSRFLHPGREYEPPIASRPRSRTVRRRRNEPLLVLITLAAMLAVASLVFLAAYRPSPHAQYTLGSTGKTSPPPVNTNPALPPASTTQTTTAAARPKIFHVTLTASAACWLQANLGSTSGAGVMAAGGIDLGGGYTLDPASVAQLSIRSTVPIVLQLGAPGNVTLTLNGKTVAIPPAGSPAVVRITARGVTAA
jgi:cytoskeletal protein RodZ